jgi:hydrogenase maturation protease
VSDVAGQSERRKCVPKLPGHLRVVGCGNAFAGDDAAGLEIVRRLREQNPCEAEIRAMPQASVELEELFEGADTVLFIDAVASGAPPGTLHLLALPSPEVEPRALSSLSSHGWHLPEVLRLRAALGQRTPRLMLLGVEVETVSPGAARSEAVEEAIRTVVERFSSLRSLLERAGDGAGQAARRFLPGDDSFPGGG